MESSCPSGGWTLYTEENGLADTRIRVLEVDSAGTIWVGYLTGEINMLQDGIWMRPINSIGYPTFTVNDIVPLNNGVVWVGTQSGQLTYYRDGIWHSYYDLMENGGTAIYDIEVAPDGRVWAGAWDGLFQLQIDHWVEAPKPVADDIQMTVKTVHLDQRGGLWIGAKYDLYYYRNGAWGMVGSDTMKIQDVQEIEEEPSGRIWFAGRGGVYSFDGERWDRTFLVEVEEPDTVEIKTMNSVSIGPDGKVWVAGPPGSYVLQDGSWKKIVPGAGSPEKKLFLVEVDPWGAVWFASGEGILCYNP